ncbi:Chlorophyll(ide) b reductase NOL, chloroplastic, partial [Mucuna pruriens]
MAATLSFHFPYPTLSTHTRISLTSLSQIKPCTVVSRQNVCISNNTLCAFRNSISPTFLAAASRNTQPMLPPYNVLITGSTKGIGYALVKEFLKAGDNVVICSRSDERVEAAVQSLRAEFGKQHVWGTKCDVRNADDVKNLVSFAQEKLKYIDIWIFYCSQDLWDIVEEGFIAPADTSILTATQKKKLNENK